MLEPASPYPLIGHFPPLPVQILWPSWEAHPVLGEKQLDLSFNGKHFKRTFLLAAVAFLLINVDF
jgi:hypothetical protein